MNGRLGGMFAVLLLVANAAAQEAPAPRKIYTQSPSFRLPVQIADKDRAELAELKLFVRVLPGEWTCRETALPTQNAFTFRAPQDGEYWFSFVTVDKAGKMLPADLAVEPPGLIVVVDSLPPALEVRPLPAATGQAYLQVRVLDANPDYATVKAEYEVQGKWARLEPLAETPGIFLVPDAKILQGKVRVSGADKAGNTAAREIDLAPGATSAVATATSAKIANPPASLPGNLGGSALLLGNLSPASAASSTLPTRPRETPIVNARHCRMDFSVEANVSGESRVEVWITPDQGKTWLLKGESRDVRGPAQVEFPGDGLFGYTFVVKSAAGSNSPAPGDAPDGWIEVDTVSPVAEFLDVVLDGATLAISWVAHDKNFGPEPVAIYFANQAGGPWQAIAGKLPATGTYRWELPKGIASRVFLRLEAVDRAANVTRTDLPDPVSLDPNRPKITLRSVTPDEPK